MSWSAGTFTAIPSVNVRVSRNHLEKLKVTDYICRINLLVKEVYIHISQHYKGSLLNSFIRLILIELVEVTNTFQQLGQILAAMLRSDISNDDNRRKRSENFKHYCFNTPATTQSGKS